MPHMATAFFADVGAALIAASLDHALCIMCAEANPSDCHHSHIADWLVAEMREPAARLF